MITYKELLHGHFISDVPIAHQHNLEELLVRINKVRTAYGKPMIVTSGYRNPMDQARINPKATRSNHLTGCAVDIQDTDGDLHKFLKENPKVLEDAQLWCEERQGGWTHFQCKPPKSGKRWFQP